MSPTPNALVTARDTAAVMVIKKSIVAGSADLCPRRHIAPESPTRIMSIPARSSRGAVW